MGTWTSCEAGCWWPPRRSSRARSCAASCSCSTTTTTARSGVIVNRPLRVRRRRRAAGLGRSRQRAGLPVRRRPGRRWTRRWPWGSSPTSRAVPPGWRQMAGRVGLVDLDGPAAGGRRARRSAGVRRATPAGVPGSSRARWTRAPGSCVDALEQRPHLAASRALWREVLRRQDGDVRFWTTFPDDPSAN